MKAREIIGKRIARVDQTFVNDGEHMPRWEIERLVFTDGSYLTFGVNEHIDSYGVSTHYWKRHKHA